MSSSGASTASANRWHVGTPRTSSKEDPGAGIPPVARIVQPVWFWRRHATSGVAMSDGSGSRRSWRDKAIGAVSALTVAFVAGSLVVVFVVRPYDDAARQEAAEREEQQHEEEVAQAAARSRLENVQGQLRAETQGDPDEDGPCPDNTDPAVVAAAVDHVLWVETKTLEASSKKEWVAVWILLSPEVMNDRFGPCEFLMDPRGVDDLQLEVSVEPQQSPDFES